MDAPEEAVRLFGENVAPMERSAWYEWGTAEGAAGNPTFAAWLGVVSLADQAGGVRPTNNQAKLGLAGLGVTFEVLFAAYSDRIFVKARGAVAVLGLTLPLDSKARRYFEKHQRESRGEGVLDMDVDTALEVFETAARAVGELRDSKDLIGSQIAPSEELTFRGLRRLFTARRRR